MRHTIALPAVLTADAIAAGAQAQLLKSIAALPQGAEITLYASNVQSFDSAGLALLLACRRAALTQKKSVCVQGWTVSLQSLAQVYGVMPLLDSGLATPSD